LGGQILASISGLGFPTFAIKAFDMLVDTFILCYTVLSSNPSIAARTLRNIRNPPI